MAKKIAIKKLSPNAKKVIVLGCMVALLAVTGVLNFVLNDRLGSSSEPPVNGGATVETFFSSYRADREPARAEEFSYLDAIIASADSSESVKTSAEQKKLELLANIETELVLENLIKAKGFEDAVVTMSTNNVNIIVNKAELTSEEVSQILNIILGETSYTATQTVVVPYQV